MYTIHLKTIDSTNTYAKENAAFFPKGKITCITADAQTAGRGRQQRSWISPPSVNLYVTFFFQLPMETLHITSIGQVLALSCTSLLEKYRLFPQIKWPNDIQLDGKKVGGILCETAFHPPLVDLFLGIGLNMNMKRELLAKIDQPATSLFVETGVLWDREALLGELQTTFEKDLNLFKQEGFASFYTKLNHLLAMKGQTITLFDGQRKWTGICHSVAPTGELNLKLENGEIKAFASGDVQNSPL